MVRNISTTATNVSYQVEDGTGTVDCRLWLDTSNDDNGKTDGIGEQDLVPVSAFVNLTPGQTIRKFWRLYSAGIATAIGAV